MPVLVLTGPAVPHAAAFVRPEALPDALAHPGAVALDLDNTADVAVLAPHLPRIALIRIAFPAFADGRGFSLGQRLRQLGYRGRLRAQGPLIPDQRAALVGSGFDELELTAEVLDRQGGAGAWAARPSQSPFVRRRQRQAVPRASAA